jgi:DNA-binding NtrC family response regulator
VDTPGTPTVLVVEDEPSLRQLISTRLQRSGRFTTRAPELDRWLEDTIESRPDVLLLDLRLGAEDAVECIPQVLACCPRTMVAALTASPAEDEEPRTLHAGAFVYYEKDMLPRLEDYLAEDLALFHRALEGEDVVAPSAIARRGVAASRTPTADASGTRRE